MLAYSGASLHAQNTATATGTTHANIMKPIALTWEHPLNFGVFTVPTGPVVLREVGPSTPPITGFNYNNINQPPTIVSGLGNTALTNLAQFGAGSAGNPGPNIDYVTGENNASYSITLPGGSINIVGQTYHQTMSLDNFQAYILGIVVTGGNLDGTGYQYFSVGADLHAATGQDADNYVGSYSVTVTYN